MTCISTRRDTGPQDVSDEHTARVRPAPEHDWPVLILLGAQNLVELQRKSVEMADVERAKIVVKGIVK